MDIINVHLAESAVQFERAIHLRNAHCAVAALNRGISMNGGSLDGAKGSLQLGAPVDFSRDDLPVVVFGFERTTNIVDVDRGEAGVNRCAGADATTSDVAIPRSTNEFLFDIEESDG